MSDPLLPRVGGVLSADIAVPEHERELRFYSRVLTTGERPLWREDLLNNQGTPIIGLGKRTAEYEHLPLQWMPHIQVVDVAASVERALELNGRVLLQGKDDTGKSLWAGLLDPDGAAFGIIPFVPAAAPSNEESSVADATSSPVGCIAWLDLTVGDASNIRDFYCEVVAWSAQSAAMQDDKGAYADYNLLGDDGGAVAGICHARGVNLGLPATWLIYLPVGNLAESLRHVEEEGGRIIKATQGSEGEYTYAVVQDPVGACVALVPG